MKAVKMLEKCLGNIGLMKFKQADYFLKWKSFNIIRFIVVKRIQIEKIKGKMMNIKSVLLEKMVSVIKQGDEPMRIKE